MLHWNVFHEFQPTGGVAAMTADAEASFPRGVEPASVPELDPARDPELDPDDDPEEPELDPDDALDPELKPAPELEPDPGGRPASLEDAPEPDPNPELEAPELSPNWAPESGTAPAPSELVDPPTSAPELDEALEPSRLSDPEEGDEQPAAAIAPRAHTKAHRRAPDANQSLDGEGQAREDLASAIVRGSRLTLYWCRDGAGSVTTSVALHGAEPRTSLFSTASSRSLQAHPRTWALAEAQSLRMAHVSRESAPPARAAIELRAPS
jgi:hypothetical protein